MKDPSEFIRAYLIQTRAEIDTEKKERDQLLNFAVLVLGAIGFAISQNESAQKFLQEPPALVIEISALVIISSLFWIRYKKLQQIADRWFVLNRLLKRHFSQDYVDELLEGVVVKSLRSWKYVANDVILNLALCFPIYGLLILQSFAAYSISQWWRFITAIASIVLHSIFSSLILSKKLNDPLPSPMVDAAKERAKKTK